VAAPPAAIETGTPAGATQCTCQGPGFLAIHYMCDTHGTLPFPDPGPHDALDAMQRPTGLTDASHNYTPDHNDGQIASSVDASVTGQTVN
jgi:hypothetical protein